MTITRSGTTREMASRVQNLEALGVSYFWSGEAYGADAVSTLGYLAAITERAHIGSSILPLYSRTPALMAMTAAGLDLLSDGRFILGLGTSGPQVVEGLHGVPYDAPIGRTREVIDICRLAWRREPVAYDGSHYQLPLANDRGTGLGKTLKLMNRPIRDQIPIYLAALGPRNVELAAEACEGWLPFHYWPERAERVWGAALRAGSSKRSPELQRLRIVAGGALAIGSGLESLRDRVRPALALYFGGMGAKGKNFYNEVLRRYGFEEQAERIQDLFLEGNRDEAAELIPDSLVAGVSLIGDEGYVRDRVSAFREAGVTVLNVDPIGPNGQKDIETLASWLA